MITKIIFAALLTFTFINLDIYLNKLRQDKIHMEKTLHYERKKLYEYKRQVEYYNIFLKELDGILKEPDFGSAINVKNKVKSAIADVNRLSHF